MILTLFLILGAIIGALGVMAGLEQTKEKTETKVIVNE